MRDLAELKLVRLFLVVIMLGTALPAGALAQSPPGAPPAETASAVADSTQVAAMPPEQALAQARELVKSGDNDRAVELLKAALVARALPTALQRDLYLQLIKTYVYLGNDLRFRPQGREAANLNYRAARERVAECLAIPALRHTKPEPVTDYPAEMVRLFGEVRAERFGAFRVVGVEPAEATVRFDGETLKLSASGVRGDDDLAVGPHRVEVSAPKHRTLTETVTITPGATLERSYSLTRNRGARWYVTRGALAVGVGVGLGLLVGHGNGQGGTTAESPLPAAPPPPSR